MIDASVPCNCLENRIHRRQFFWRTLPSDLIKSLYFFFVSLTRIRGSLQTEQVGSQNSIGELAWAI